MAQFVSKYPQDAVEFKEIIPRSLPMSRILVTGAGGYVGIVLVERLLGEGHYVVGLDRFFFGEELLGPSVLNHPNFTLCKTDTRHVTAETFLGIDVVIDLAGLSNDPTSELDPELTRQINFVGTCNVADCARKADVKRFVYASSCSVYGNSVDELVDEKSTPIPVSTYAQTKLDAERWLLERATDERFIVTLFRCATIFGYSRRMRFDLVVNLMTLCAWRDRRIIVTNSGNQWRPVIHILDAVEGILRLMDADPFIVQGEIFNLGSTEQNYRMYQLAYLIRSLFTDVKVEMIPGDPDRRSYRVDFTKLQRVLDFVPTRSAIYGANEIRAALDKGLIDITDPRNNTLTYYKYLIDVERTFKRVAIKERML